MENVVQHRKQSLLFQAIVFGLLFGFLLQKGGVAKYHVLEGQLLLTDFTVMKIMLSAIFVGMIGLHLLHRAKKIKFHIKPTKLASNIVGGLIFGVGFAFAGYCPGTGAAGLGQGDLVALIFMSGLVAGSYLFAECSGFLKRSIDTWANKGKIALHTAFRMNTAWSIAFMAIAISGSLLILNRLQL